MKLLILFAPGGLGDVGKHAIRAALDRPGDVKKITVLTEYPEALEETNWKCSCPEELHKFSNEERQRLEIVKVTSWAGAEEQSSLLKHFQEADVVISAVAHRQPAVMYPDVKHVRGLEGNRFITRAMTKTNTNRVILISSIGIGQDKPSMEWHWAGKIMDCIFHTCGRQVFRDLNLIEEMYSDADFDYVFVHPVGLGEEIPPVNDYVIQKKKWEDRDIDGNMSKLDCARFVVEEAVSPKYHKKTVVVGARLNKK